MRFAHLKTQLFPPETEEKARRLLERFTLFCQRIGGNPQVREEGLTYSLTCLVPQNARFNMRVSAESGGIWMEVQRGEEKTVLRLPAEDLPPISTVEVKPPGRGWSCNIDLWDGENRRVHAGCSIAKGVGRRGLFEVKVYKLFDLMVIRAPPEKE